MFFKPNYRRNSDNKKDISDVSLLGVRHMRHMVYLWEHFGMWGPGRRQRRCLEGGDERVREQMEQMKGSAEVM